MPTVLAGPILRTVTETSVTVWLALKESAAVTLTICEGDSAIAPTVGSPGTAHASKIGPNLYIVAVTAEACIPAKLALGKPDFSGCRWRSRRDEGPPPGNGRQGRNRVLVPPFRRELPAAAELYRAGPLCARLVP